MKLIAKKIIILISVFLLFIIPSTDLSGAVKEKKLSKKVKKSLSENRIKKKRSKRYTKHARRSSGNGPDLRALTTESPYTDVLDNGVNPLETTSPL